MNWTGGGLSRHSRNVKGAIAGKQKQHFAKVRSGQQGVPSQMSPVKWSVFNQIASASRNTTQPEEKASGRSRRAHDVREAVDAASDRPVRESAQRERDGKRRRVSPQELSHHITYSSPANSPDIGEIRKIKQEQGHVDQTFGASLHSRRPPKRKGHAESPPEEERRDGQGIMEKRRKILSKEDWVGVGFQKPPDLKYAPPQKVDQIGRRRKVSASHRAQYEHRRREIPPAFMTQALEKDHHEKKARDSDVRISIGGKELRVGVSSSSVFERAPTEPLHKSGGTASVDVMLLDCEDVHRQKSSREHDYHSGAGQSLVRELGKNPPADANFSLFQRSPSIMGATEYPETPHAAKDSTFGNTRIGTESRLRLSSNNSYVNHSVRRQNMSSNHSGRTLTTSEIQKLYHDFRDQPEEPDDTLTYEVSLDARGDSTVHFLPDLSVRRLRKNFDEISNTSELNMRAVSSDRVTLLSFGDGHENTRAINHRHKVPHVSPEPAKRIFRSPPLMQHPAPRSSRTSQILRSEDSDTEISMVVQTGKVEPTSRQARDLDEQVWRSWVLQEDSLDQNKDWEPLASEQRSVTPGISTYDTRSKHLAQSSPIPVEESHNDATEQQHPIGVGLDDMDGTTDNDESALQLHTELESYLHPEPTPSSDEQGANEKDNIMMPEPALVPSPVNPKTKVDENALWQKFVFTSDSEGEEYTASKPPPINPRKVFSVPQVYSEDSSLLAHPSTETDEPPQRATTKYGHRSFADLRRVSRKISPSEPELDEDISLAAATQGTRAAHSTTTISETPQRTVDERYTNYATQGSGTYRSSPDILSTGTPILGGKTNNTTSISETPQRTVDERYTNYATQGSDSGTRDSSPDLLSIETPVLRRSSYQRTNNTGLRSSSNQQSSSQKSSEKKQKVVFTRPKPFVGKMKPGSSSMEKKKPLRIGKKSVAKTGAKKAVGGGVEKMVDIGRRKEGKREKDVYDFLSDDDDEDDGAESIEDD